MTTGPVVGIDPSLRATGIAILRHPTTADTPNRPQLHTIGEDGRRAATYADRGLRLRRQVFKVLKTIPDTTALAVIEGPAYAATHGGIHERAGLWWALYVGLTARKIPVAVCPPQTRAKFATGKGNASKTEVLDAMRHHWTTATIRNDNESDALALATAGGMRLLWWPTEADHHESALAAIEWPEAVKTDLAQRIKAGW